MKKVSELEGEKLDYWVAQADKRGPFVSKSGVNGETTYKWAPSTDWSQGGPIIERESIQLEISPAGWYAYDGVVIQHAKTPLIAAMRCFVASKFGEEVSD